MEQMQQFFERYARESPEGPLNDSSVAILYNQNASSSEQILYFLIVLKFKLWKRVIENDCYQHKLEITYFHLVGNGRKLDQDFPLSCLRNSQPNNSNLWIYASFLMLLLY